MPLRFHKSIKLGKLLKININKNSISLSAGVKGAHVTVNNKGRKTASVGLPGTGLSYQKTLESETDVKKKKLMKDNKEKEDNGLLHSIKEQLSDAVSDIKEEIKNDIAENNNGGNDEKDN